MVNDKFLDNFWTAKHFGHFWTTFFVGIGLRIEHNLRNVRNLHLKSESFSVTSYVQFNMERDFHQKTTLNSITHQKLWLLQADQLQ